MTVQSVDAVKTIGCISDLVPHVEQMKFFCRVTVSELDCSVFDMSRIRAKKSPIWVGSGCCLNVALECCGVLSV